jgi:branched-chain amino acid transport system ATP-binding protein
MPDPAPPALLEGRDLVVRFDGVLAVEGMSIAVRQGELVGLIGPNGAGKTTLFNLLAGTLRAASGSIRIGGAEVAAEGAERRIGRGLGRTFQIPRPFAEMTVLENLLVGRQDQPGERVLANFLAPRRVAAAERAALARAREIAAFVRLDALADQPARILSGGQRKLLELGRVLMADPSVILLDEPAAGVNPALLELIIDRVQALSAAGRTILLIEHNMDMVARLCSRVVVMAAGRQLAEGPPAAVARDPAVVEAYLGSAA